MNKGNEFYGHQTGRIENKNLILEFLLDAGPRIVRAFIKGSQENQFAEVPHMAEQTPLGDYHFYGGHRLWTAPEVNPNSYLVDDLDIIIEEISDGVRLTQPAESRLGIQKTIEISLSPDRAAATIQHTIQNQNLWPIEVAPWAITQMKWGGIAIMPHQAPPPQAYLPNRSIIFWPYTRYNDSRLKLDEPYILVDSKQGSSPFKIGLLNHEGWLGYLRNDQMFIKRFDPQVSRAHVDFNCNAEVYCNDQFLELETIGPLVKLNSGQKTTHYEEWEWLPAKEMTSTANIQQFIHAL